MSDPNCGKCHGKGKHKCTTCHGEKKVACEKCRGKGKFKNCIKCGGSGKVTCNYCDRTGKDSIPCPVCGKLEDLFFKKSLENAFTICLLSFV